jgi:hypothetical protein
MVHRSPGGWAVVLRACSPGCDGMGRPPRVGATVPVGQNATQGRGSTYAESTTQGTGNGGGARPRTRPARRAGRPHARLLARPTEVTHLRRRPAGRTDAGRGRHHRRGRERPVRRSAVRAAPHRRVQLSGRPQQRGRGGSHRGGGAGTPGTRSQRRRRGRAHRGPTVRRHPPGDRRRCRRTPWGHL